MAQKRHTHGKEERTCTDTNKRNTPQIGLLLAEESVEPTLGLLMLRGLGMRGSDVDRAADRTGGHTGRAAVKALERGTVANRRHGRGLELRR